ncbi:hypothetical protein AMTRI_Chr04g185740 [Amborella trichopoda]
MESMPVNWDALDSIVLDYAIADNLLHPSSPSSSPSLSPTLSLSSSSYHSRLLIQQIRHSLGSGDVDSALHLLQRHAPSVLDDHRLLFRLHKQKFIELLRKGTDADRDSAIRCLRMALAPCALDAYPWSERRRFDLAALISSVLKAQLQAYDPLFSMALRYLIRIHNGFCFRQGVTSPISDVAKKLLPEERDPPAIPQENLYEAPPFDEVEIQALAHAVELTRQGAVDALRYAKGNLFLAFQNEVCRMKLDVAAFDEIVHEYCVYRGLVDGCPVPPSDMPTIRIYSKAYQESEDSTTSLNVEGGTSQRSDGEASVNFVKVGDLQEVIADVTSMRDNDAEMRFGDEMMNNREDCSTSEPYEPEGYARKFQRPRSYVNRERNKRKRWRGRVESLAEVKPDMSYAGNDRAEVISPPMDGNGKVDLKQDVEDNQNREVHKYDMVLEVRDLASRGMAAKVVEEINALNPQFLEQNPVLLFQLKQVEFLTLVKGGDHRNALKVACSDLGPLAAGNPALLKPLKETLLAFLNPNEDALAKCVPLSVLSTSLQVLLGKSLGIEEPQLMKIMRATLYSHTEWFKLQMCKDRFEEFLKINCLKEIDSPWFTDAASKTTVDSCSYGASQVTISTSSRRSSDTGDLINEPSREIIFDETAILKVMEFLALPRSDAIQLLAQYNGNAETVIQQIFA